MKIKLWGFFVVILIFGSLVGIGSVKYTDNFALASELEDKQDDLQDLQKKKETYQKIVNLKVNQATLLNSQIAILENQTNQLQGTIQENATKLEVTKQEIARLSAQIDEKEKEIRNQKEFLAEFVRLYYDWSSGEIQSALFSDGLQNPFAVSDQSDQFQEKVSEAVEKIESVKKSLSRDQESLDQDKIEIETLNTKLEQQTVYLESTKKEKEMLYTQTTAEKNQYAQKLSKVEGQIRDIEREIEQLEAVKSNAINMANLPSKKGAGMDFPVKDPAVTQRYGKTTFTRWYSFHNGVDFGIPTGTKILAAAAGKVVATGDCGRYAYGKWVAIDHGNGLVTLYGHLSQQKTSKGKSVKKGDTIGLSGNTGYSTGPHLHFSVFTSDSFEVVASTSVAGVNIPTGAHINPMMYLP